MALQIKIPGADFSAAGLPKFIKRSKGFDVASLEALYALEDGTIGQPVAVAFDSSGKGRHGSLLAGSVSPIKTVGGWDNNAANTDGGEGFFFETGVPIDGEKTIFVCTRSDLVAPAGSQTFITAMTTKPVVPVSASQGPDGPLLVINRDLRGPTTDTAAKNADSGFYIGTNTPALVTAGFGTNPRPALAASPNRSGQDTWITAALSVSFASKKIRLVVGATATTLDMTEAVYINSLQGLGQTIKFGVGKNANLLPNGQLGIAGIYSKESSLIELRDLCSRMSARMALRGITAY